MTGELPPGWRPLRHADRDDLPRPLRASIEDLARRLGAPPPAALAIVHTRWAEAVGEQLAEHCRPGSLRDGVLVVLTEEPGWASQLKFLVGQLADRVNEAVGSPLVREVEVRLVRPRQG